MKEKDIKRVTRLTALLTQLQTKRLITATELAKKFEVSVRTIYRDIRSLEQIGVPILIEEGKGFALMEGFRLAPIMFTEQEANALITAQQLMVKNKDASLVNAYSGAIDKIKAVMRLSLIDKTDLLGERTYFRTNETKLKTSSYLSDLQLALTNYKVVILHYKSVQTKKKSSREVEPFALYSTQDNWLLIAWCRLRKDYRAFRLDGIEKMEISDKRFKRHSISLEQYFELCREKSLSGYLTPDT